MLVVKIFHLGILFTVFIFTIHINSVYATVDAKNNNSSSTGNNTSSIKPDNYAIKVGEGNNTVSFTKYFPDYVEITAGDSITWYNGVDVPNPHTVTFIRDLDNAEKIGVPFYVSNNTQFTPVLNNLGEPLEETTGNGTRIVMMLNARALTPTVITADDKVVELKKDSVYALMEVKNSLTLDRCYLWIKNRNLITLLATPSLLFLINPDFMNILVYFILG